MTLQERALLQERVRTLVLRHALEAALGRLADASRAAGRDAEAGFLALEGAFAATARGLADRATAQKLTVLVAIEDAVATIRTAFDAAHTRLDAPAAEAGALAA